MRLANMMMKVTRLLALIAAVTSFGAGCAVDNDFYVDDNEPRTLRNLPRRMVYAYSRNEIVCTPTAIGNLIGLPAAPIFGAAGFVLAAPFMPLDRELPKRVGTKAALVPILAGGAVTGTPFLPLSYLGEEKNHCGFH